MTERLDHPIRDLPGDALVRGDIHLRVYGLPENEVQRTTGKHMPHWIKRLYQSYGADPGRPPLSASMEAVAESLGHRLEGMALILQKAEARGWKAAVEGEELVIYTGIGDDEVYVQLEEDGVLTLVQELAHRDAIPGE
ncbi:MAG: hypothetical protein ACR2MY_09185 [Candidatus Dormibacteria bacterium]